MATTPTPGAITPTGRNLDVAMKDKAWLAVQALDGTEAYTRAGALDVNAEGLLVQRNGLQVIGDGGPITVPPNSELTIGSDGTISAKGPTGRPTAIGRLKLVTPEAPLTPRHGRPVPRRRGRPAADANAKPAGRRAGRLQRQARLKPWSP